MAKRVTRETWRQQQSHGSSARLWLIVRRTIATLCVMGLAIGFFYLLLRPWLEPRTYFLFVASEQSREMGSDPIAFAMEDFASLTPLEPAIAKSPDAESALRLVSFATPRDLAEQLDELRQLPLRAQDVLILSLAAQGLVENSEPYLICANYQASAPDGGRVAMKELFQSLAELAPRTKLILLNAEATKKTFDQVAWPTPFRIAWTNAVRAGRSIALGAYRQLRSRTRVYLVCIEAVGLWLRRLARAHRRRGLRQRSDDSAR